MDQRVAKLVVGALMVSAVADCKRDAATRAPSAASTTPPTGGAPMPMMPPGGTSVSGSYEGTDSTQMLVPGIDAGPAEPGRGRVDLAEADQTITVTLIDTDGGAPCVLRATRGAARTPGSTIGTIAPGQTCTDQSNDGTIVLNTSAGSIAVAGNSLALQLNGNVVMTPNGGGSPLNLTMVYNFTGMRR